jgi:hypothetical protein
LGIFQLNKGIQAAWFGTQRKTGLTVQIKYFEYIARYNACHFKPFQHMKQLILLYLAAGLFFQTAFSQSNAPYLVTYSIKMKYELPDSVKNKKIEVKLNFGNDTTAAGELTEFLLGDFMKEPIDIDLSLYIIANSDSSKLFFDPNNNSNTPGNVGVRINLNTPDTIFYKKGQWRKSGKDDEPISLITWNVIETKEKKNILGYECIKFVSLDSTRKEDIVIWASKKLPNTILPTTGLKEFKYGILEIDNIKNHSHTIAIKVERL